MLAESGVLAYTAFAAAGSVAGGREMMMLTGELTWIGLAIAVIVGWLAGAAGNWAADILPHLGVDRGQADRRGFPLWHYLTLPWYPFRKGVCPHCGELCPRRAPSLEVGTIAVFTLAWLRVPGDLTLLLVTWCYAIFLLTVLVIDLEHRRVLNVMLIPAAVAALLFSLLPGTPQPLNALLGAAVGLGVFLLLALIGRGALGAGDVKLAAVIGLMTGYPGVLTALVIGIALGGVAALALLITRRAGRKSFMAYAPYLSLGALAVLLGLLGGR